MRTVLNVKMNRMTFLIIDVLNNNAKQKTLIVDTCNEITTTQRTCQVMAVDVNMPHKGAVAIDVLNVEIHLHKKRNDENMTIVNIIIIIIIIIILTYTSELQRKNASSTA